MERIKDEKIIQEKWKDIPGYKGIYQASSLGRIRSVERYIKCNVSNQHKVNIKTKRHIKEKILKCGIDKDGYKKISLSKDGKTKYFRVCRLIAMTFIPNENQSLQVNHKDENKKNDCIDNLEWCTCKYNQNYGTRNKRISRSRMREVYKLDLNGNFIEKFKSIIDASKSSNRNYRNISAVCNGKQKTCGGYKWVYAKTFKTENKMEG